MPNQAGRGSVNRLRHLALGSELAGGVLVPVLIGLWLDRRFDSSPTYVLIGTFLGLAAATASLIRVVKLRSNG
ncbi:MAG: AtpZ/AtpI family protein [Phycisphaeraceae bacterium]|nr:AtpZ/AtpI family protein [Phycisphaeraceae bacterium]